MFDLDKVPKNPDAAIDYLIKYLLATATLQSHYYSGEILKNREREIYDAIDTLRFVVSRSTLPNNVKEFARSALKATHDNGRGRFTQLIDLETTVRALKSKIIAAKLENHFEVDDEYLAVLAKDERRKILNTVADLRALVIDASYITDAVKRRLLQMITAVEAEVFREKFDYRRITELGDYVGIALGNVGTKGKPFFDRIAEIAGMVRGRTPAHKELEGPEEQKRLPAPQKD